MNKVSNNGNEYKQGDIVKVRKEWLDADAEDKAKMDDYAEFCAYLAEREAMDEEDVTIRACKLCHFLLE